MVWRDGWRRSVSLLNSLLHSDVSGVSARKYSAILFDLDGTLLDSLADIACATNRVLAAAGAPEHEVPAYRTLVGDGVVVLMERALPADRRDQATIAACVNAFGEEYGRSWDVQTRPYAGICELLETLTQRGVALAVLSNKPHEFTSQCVARFLAGHPWQAVLGQRAGVPRKPDPAGALEIARQLEVTPGDCLFVGDSSVDMQTAVAAGMVAVGAAWGFRPRAELWEHGAAAVIDHPADLLPLVFPDD